MFGECAAFWRDVTANENADKTRGLCQVYISLREHKYADNGSMGRVRPDMSRSLPFDRFA